MKINERKKMVTPLTELLERFPWLWSVLACWEYNETSPECNFVEVNDDILSQIFDINDKKTSLFIKSSLINDKDEIIAERVYCFNDECFEVHARKAKASHSLGYFIVFFAWLIPIPNLIIEYIVVQKSDSITIYYPPEGTSLLEMAIRIEEANKTSPCSADWLRGKGLLKK